MKIKLPLLIVSLLFLSACSSSDNTSDVQSTQESSTTSSELTPIQMSDSNENGRYFLTSHATENGIENVEYIRRGNENDTYGKMQIKCSNNEIRKNSSDNHEALVAMDLGDWYTPTPDWTDKDIFNFICNH